MRVLDLFAGLEGWSEPFRAAGHDVISLDNDPSFGCDITADILDWDPRDLPWRPDIILASPPCEAFSVMSIGTHWTGGRRAYEPKTEKAVLGMALVRRTVQLILEFTPAFWVIENPRGVLRKLDIIPGEPDTIWACHFGAPWAKPTDLWNNLPAFFNFRGVCHNQRPEHPFNCCCRDHVSARRGARSGTQRDASAAERAKIPAELARAVMLSVDAPYYMSRGA